MSDGTFMIEAGTYNQLSIRTCDFKGTAFTPHKVETWLSENLTKKAF